MAVGKEIRGKIKSVENTRKITKAMEMVAASKMRKAQERMRALTGRGLFDLDFDENGQMVFKLSRDAGRAQLAELSGGRN